MNDDFLVGDCLARAHAVGQIAEDLALGEFPANEPKGLAIAIGGLSRLIAGHILEARHDPSYSPARRMSHFRTVNGSLKHLSELLRYVDGAVTHKVPWSIVDPIQEVARRLVPDVTIMLRPKWRYNYAILLEELSKWLREQFRFMVSARSMREEVEPLLSSIGGSFYIVSFPNIERKSVLLHAVLGHEIGHLVAEKFLASDSSTLPSPLHKKVVASVENDVKAERMLPLFRTMGISTRLAEITAYRARAIEEIGADIVGINMLGPAALFGYYASAQTMAMNRAPSLANDRYPPWVLRLRYCLERIAELGYCDWSSLSANTPREHALYLEAFRAQLEEIEAVKVEKPDLGKDLVATVAYEWVEGTIPKLIEYVNSVCSDHSLVQTPLVLWKQATKLAHERLAEDLPPNTIDDNATPPSPAVTEAILNGGWLYRLARLGGCPMNMRPEEISRYSELRSRLDRLTLRGLELAHLQRQYEAKREELKR